MFNLAYRMLRQREDAEDITQEAFLKAFDALHRLRDDKALGSWICRIAANLCMGRLRSRARRAEMPQEPSSLEEAAQRFEDWTALDSAARVRDAIAHLPPKYRLAVIAFYLEGRSYDEAARVAGVPVLTLKTRLYRARRMLRDLLGDAPARKEESAPRNVGMFAPACSRSSTGF